MFKETIFIKTNKYDNLTFFEHKVLIHNYTTGIMDTDSNANSDAKEPDTSTESKLRESKTRTEGLTLTTTPTLPSSRMFQDRQRHLKAWRQT